MPSDSNTIGFSRGFNQSFWRHILLCINFDNWVVLSVFRGFRAFLEKFDLELFFTKATFLTMGLIFGEGLAYQSVVYFLMDYLTNNWTGEVFRKSAAVVNAVEGFSCILELILTFLADQFFGRFIIIVISTTAFVIGLALYWIFDLFLSPRMGTLIFIISIPILAIGVAGKYILTDFLKEQLSGGIDGYDEHQKETTIYRRGNTWLGLAWVCSVSLSFFYIQDQTWSVNFAITTVTIVVAFILFLLGYTIYSYEKRIRSPVVTVYKALRAAILKRNLQNHSDCEKSWLDKASTIEPSLHPFDQERQGRLCTIEDVEEVKRLLALIPTCASFLIYSVVKAAGSTFFLEQGANMKRSDDIIYIALMRYFSRVATSILVGKIKAKSRKWFGNPLCQVGAGMFSSPLCCLPAYLVETRRLYLIQEHHVSLDQDVTEIPMSIYWLSPQFILMGIMSALAEDGLEDLIRTQLRTVEMKKYSEPFCQSILGTGKLLTILWVYICGSWFSKTINDSQLDKYYLLLFALSLFNIPLYCFLAIKLERSKNLPEEKMESQG